MRSPSHGRVKMFVDFHSRTSGTVDLLRRTETRALAIWLQVFTYRICVRNTVRLWDGLDRVRYCKAREINHDG